MPNRHEKKLIDATVSTLVGAGLGACISALSGNIPLTAIGTALGTGTGLIISDRALKLSFIERIIQQKKLKQLITEKFDSDIRNGICCEPDYVYKKTKDILDNLKALKIYDGSRADKRFSDPIKINVTNNLLITDEVLTKDLALLSTIKPINISVSSVNVAVSSALQSLVDRFEGNYGLDIKINNNFSNSAKLIKSLIDGERPDFLVASIDPFSLVGEEFTKNYSLLYPINTVKQHIYMKCGKTIYNNYRKIHVYQDSSAQFHFSLQKRGVPANAEAVKFDDTDFFKNKDDEVYSGDYVIAWEPLASIYRESKHFEILPGSEHEIIFCLFCNGSWRENKMEKALDSFGRVFLKELFYSVRNKNKVLKALFKNNSYMNSFADGAGLVWTPEL